MSNVVRWTNLHFLSDYLNNINSTHFYRCSLVYPSRRVGFNYCYWCRVCLWDESFSRESCVTAGTNTYSIIKVQMKMMYFLKCCWIENENGGSFQSCFLILHFQWNVWNLNCLQFKTVFGRTCCLNMLWSELGIGESKFIIQMSKLSALSQPVISVQVLNYYHILFNSLNTAK